MIADATPRLGSPVIASHRDTLSTRRFWLLVLLARGVRLGDAADWFHANRRGRA
jgi:hypothetical protein